MLSYYKFSTGSDFLPLSYVLSDCFLLLSLTDDFYVAGNAAPIEGSSEHGWFSCRMAGGCLLACKQIHLFVSCCILATSQVIGVVS